MFHVLPDVGPVYSVSIIPTGGQGIYDASSGEKTKCLIQRGRCFRKLRFPLGGRVAEEEIFDDITTGASQDIKQATAIAKINDYKVRYVRTPRIDQLRQ